MATTARTRTSTTPDELLMERIAKGDQAAFALFYDRFAGAVTRQICRTMGYGADVEDVRQEVFWKVWRQADRYDPTRGSPLTWIMLLARFAATDRLRASSTRPRRAGSLNEETDDWRFVAPDETDAVEAEEDRENAMHALDDLPERQQIVLKLACLRGLTRTQVANLERLPIGTVKTLMRRGTMRLKRSVDAAA